MAKTNSYKKVIAGTMTAAMVAGVVSPVAAAGKTFPDVDGHWSKESVYYLVEKGAIAGNDDGTFAPDREITRAEAATMMAKILNLPIEKGAKPSYADSQNHWASAIIAAVEKAGVVKGKGDGTFDPDGKIDRVSMASLLVEAYKLDTKVNGPLETKFDDLKDSWGKDKANILVKLGISVGTGDKWEPNKSVTKAEAAQFIAKTDKQFGGQKEEAKVESIKAINAKEIEVKLGATVKEEDVEKATFTISQGENPVKVAAKIGEDKKSVILTLEDANKLKKNNAYVVTAEGLKTADGKEIPKALEVIFFNDEVAPTVSTVSTPDGDVKVVFSEKLNENEKVTVVINGTKFVVNPKGNTVTLPKADVASVVKNGEAFNVIVTGAKDLVDNTMEMYEGKATYKVEKDVTAPEVKDVKVKEITKEDATLEVTFSEEMTNENLGTVTVKKGKDPLTATITVDPQDKTKAIVEVKGALKAEETATNLTIEFVGYKDVANNVGQKVSKEVKVTKDVVAPNFVKVVAEKDQKATFTFDKEVNAETATFDKKVVRIINQDTSEDVTTNVTVEAAKDNKKGITVKFPAAGNYKVSASKGFIQDKAGNNSAAFTTDVKIDKNKEEVVVDKEAPKVTDKAFNKDENTITVKFDKVVKGGQGAESAANVNNYTLAGAKLPEGTLITLSGDTATIELPKTFTFEKSETVKFTVSNVANASGVKMGTTNLLLDVKDTKAPEFKSAKVSNVEKKEVTLTFSEAVKVDATDLVFDLNGVPFTVAADSAKAAKETASKEVVLKLETAENVNFATGTLTLKAKELKDNATLNTVDTENNKLVAFKPVTVTR
ncbi:S-layer homology domain-containing protein [Bacillus cereus group sp. MYBK245-2]|uniref:S-layer homology domain-containing protein n=1 Tax=Bacillus pacificus TaxID=2026187 RepID=A0A3P1BVY4_9BACI|nr:MULTISPECIES: S-layer homology domain-containing protein [Bacillus cereus group]KXX86892.1 S-layer protein [Bacillus cereus]MBL3794082.1 S-layer homology domain-containing protein [Bacillus cereus]MBL3857413.1 S-layer homology domain-containing protein [Bacillus cereus]MCU5068374.1 S-layer homology domain-containing protein [Bacillus pacificus]MCU5374255.1 S-layer homology domain-containing protein [Bacillus pacificus]